MIWSSVIKQSGNAVIFSGLFEMCLCLFRCLNQCTYCKTKHARGELGSYPPEEIVARAKQAFQGNKEELEIIFFNSSSKSFILHFSEGVVEIWLTSEDTGAYGRDIGSSLPELLWQLIDVIPEGAMLRLGMTNPPYILEHLEVRIIDLVLCSALHNQNIFTCFFFRK